MTLAPDTRPPGEAASISFEVGIPAKLAVTRLHLTNFRSYAGTELAFSGAPVARVGRGHPEGFADPDRFMIAGRNLTSTKARLLLMACLMKFGSLPSAADPSAPSTREKDALEAAVAADQEVFDTH